MWEFLPEEARIALKHCNYKDYMVPRNTHFVKSAVESSDWGKSPFRI